MTKVKGAAKPEIVHILPWRKPPSQLRGRRMARGILENDLNSKLESSANGITNFGLAVSLATIVLSVPVILFYREVHTRISLVQLQNLTRIATTVNGRDELLNFPLNRSFSGALRKAVLSQMEPFSSSPCGRCNYMYPFSEKRQALVNIIWHIVELVIATVEESITYTNALK